MLYAADCFVVLQINSMPNMKPLWILAIFQLQAEAGYSHGNGRKYNQKY